MSWATIIVLVVIAFAVIGALFGGLSKLIGDMKKEAKEEGAGDVKRDVMQEELEHFRKDEVTDAAPLSPDDADRMAGELAARRLHKP